MITVRLKFIFLIACLLLSLWLLVAQVLGNTLILLACLACFVALVAFSAFKGMAIPVFLYFLPFSTLLKLQPGAISIYTIALLIAYFIYAISANNGLDRLYRLRRGGGRDGGAV